MAEDPLGPSGIVPAKSAAEASVDTTDATSQQQPSPPPQNEVPEIVVASQMGDVEKIKSLIESGKVAAQDVMPDGTTALHWAAINNRMTACKYLIEAGAEVDKKGGQLEATPLHWACRNGLVYIVHLLIQHGADPLRTDSQGFNALHLAIHSSNVLLVIYLLHQGLPVDTVDPSGRTAAHWAAYQGDALSIDALLNWGANVKIADQLGFTALHWAIVRGNRSCMKRLIEEGSDVFAMNNEGKSPRVMAEEMRTLGAWTAALDECGRYPSGALRPVYLSKRSVDIVTFLTPFLMLPVVVFLLGQLPFYFGIPLSGVVAFGSVWALRKYVLPNAYHGHHALSNSPILSGVFAASAFWVLVVYLFEILPTTAMQAPILNLVFAVLFATVFYSFFRTMFMDPGYVPRLSGVTEQREVIEDLIDRGEYDSRHFCIATYIRKPLRSKYDRRSKRVVARFDHVCPWVNNIVGVRNHRLFVVYVISLMFGVLALDWLFFGTYIDLLPEGECPIAPGPLCPALTHSNATTQLVLWASLQLSWVIMLAFVQLVQIARNITTIEAANLHRFGFMGADDFSSLPLDHHSHETATGPGEVPAFKASRRKWHSTLTRILGIDQFLSTARDALGSDQSTRRPSSNPVNYGIRRNCMDFWCPLGDWNVLHTFDDGSGSLNGNKVDYYALWDFPSKSKPRQRQGTHDYELVDQQV